MELKFSQVKQLLSLNVNRSDIHKLKSVTRISKRNYIYWLLLNYSKEDALIESRKRTPGTLEYYMYYKNLPQLEAEEQLKQFHNTKSVTKVNMISRYGEEEGNKRWKSYCDKQAETNTFEYKKKKYGWTEQQFKEYNSSRAATKDNLIRRHGVEKGTEKWNAYVERQRHAGCSLDYFIEKYGEEEGTNTYKNLNLLKSHSLESFLLRYNNDIELATKKYNEFRKQQSIPYSKISVDLFNNLQIKLNKQNINDVYYATYNHEWFINTKDNKTIFIDFFVKSLGKVIEFNGDYWHCNPLFYTENDYTNHPGTINNLVKDKWDYDLKRVNNIKEVPYIKDVLVIWEYDYRTNPLETINKCMNFLINN